MQSLLARVKKSDVITDPFPHIVIKDALDEKLCSQLASEWPALDILSQGIENRSRDIYKTSNGRFNYLTKEIFEDDRITPLWKEFIAQHTSNEFLRELLDLFQDSIAQLYPDFERKYGSFADLKAGIREIDSFQTADVLLDALLSINTPVTTKPTSVRRAHVDLPDKLFAGLFYMRDPNDTSTGGDLEIYRFKTKKPYGFTNCEISDKYVEYVKTIKYERNVLVLLINSAYSLHGVTVRSLTDSTRYFVNLVGEVKEPLFQISKYQELPYVRYIKMMKRTVKNKLKSLVLQS